MIKVEANENNTYRELVKSLGYNPLVSKLYNVGLRHVQKYLFTSLKVEPTSKVQVEYSGNRLLHIEKVDDSLEIMPPPFTMLQLQLDYEGSKGGKTITCIRAKSEDRTETFRGNEYTIIASLLDYISHTDPDLLFCPKCDRIAFPLLKKKAQDNELSLMIGRCDDEEQVRAQGSIGGRIFLEEIFYDFGYEEWGIAGLVERTKFSFAPIGLASRWLSNKSIDSRNCFELTQRGYVIQKEEYNEVSRSLYELIERDRGSITITPEIGRAHENVAALDFDSQYPNIILKNNLSYESISKAEEEFRVIPTVIEPWLKRRLYFKHIKKTLSKDSVLRHQCEQRVDALKLLLVCVTPETEILLKDGYIAISKLESRWKNSNIISVDIGNMRLVDSKIVNYIQLVNGVREFEAYKIETELGHSIIATGEHPFFTMQGWKKAAYLDINDYVAIYLLSNGNLTATQEHAPPKEEPSSRVASEQKIGLENSPFVWEKVSHKRPIHYIKDVRDLVVEPYHSFIANGFVTHNCQYGISGCCWNRFGNVLTFEEINKKSREVMLKAKVTAESNGFRIVYGDTDSLFVNKAGAVKEDYEELATRISDETTLPMSLDRHFKFIAFLPLKCDHSSSALKRYFGLTYDGEVEARGIELRRHDTPSFVRRFQVELIRQVLDCEDIQELYLNGVRRGLEMTRKALKTIKEGKVSFQELIVEKTLRKEVDQYRSNIAHRSAALQLLQRGKEVEVGDSIPFLYINRHHKNPLCRVREPETKSNYDKKAYEKMLIEAASTIFEGIGIQPALTSSTETLEKWFNQTDQ
ncbi:MAG: DNA polymerase domain-containing protein [Nitrososphaeria archaeon]